MNPKPPPPQSDELTFACRITCEAMDDHTRWIVYLPERLLWSEQGLAALFRRCREWLADPNDHPDSPDLLQIQDRWDSFHIVQIEEVEGFVPDVPDARENPSEDA